MYHYVRPFNPKMSGLKHLHIDDFKLQLDLFEKEFGFVSKENFYKSLETGIPQPGVILTFDDGLSCHYQYVLEELIRRKLWGIFYIPTKPYINHKILDVHRIHILLAINDSKKVYDLLLNLIDEEMLTGNLVKEFRELTYRHQVNDNFTNLIKRLLNYYIEYSHREVVIDELMNELVSEEYRNADQFYVTSEQIKEMQQAGMIIGSHSVSHPVFSKLSVEHQNYEIEESFRFLEKECGISLNNRTFCYPYGGFHSFTSETEKILENNNCSFSFNVEHRDIGREDLLNRRQALPRFDCNQFKFGQCRMLD